MVDWVRDGSLHPFPFTLTKDGAGVDLQIDGTTPSVSLVDGDLLLYKWLDDGTPSGATSKRVIDVSAEIEKVDAVDAPGDLKWFPVSGDMRCNTFTLVCRDADAGGAFDENRIHGYTHGRFSASTQSDNSRFNGT